MSVRISRFLDLASSVGIVALGLGLGGAIVAF
jgi:hypothetical protein